MAFLHVTFVWHYFLFSWHFFFRCVHLVTWLGTFFMELCCILHASNQMVCRHVYTIYIYEQTYINFIYVYKQLALFVNRFTFISYFAPSPTGITGPGRSKCCTHFLQKSLSTSCNAINTFGIFIIAHSPFGTRHSFTCGGTHSFVHSVFIYYLLMP